jgi:hypothetical protein
LEDLSGKGWNELLKKIVEKGDQILDITSNSP